MIRELTYQLRLTLAVELLHLILYVAPKRRKGLVIVQQVAAMASRMKEHWEEE